MSAETRTLSVVPSTLHPAAHTQAHPSDLSALLIGPSQSIAALWAQMRRVAPHFRMMLLTGEPGAGAEAAARVVHDLSPVCQAPFYKLEAKEAERLFAGGRPSALAIPTEGTLFLPSIERLSLPAQTALLHLFYTRSARSLRMIAVARSGLRALLSAGSLSPELASALGAVRLRLPSLRERPQDIPLLIEHFLGRQSASTGAPRPALAADFLPAASGCDWPGNLDQLETVLRSMIADRGDQLLTAAALASCLAASAKGPEAASSAPRLVKLDQVVQEHIRCVLLACNGNKLRAAQVLGISRSTLYRMLETPSSMADIALAS